MYVKIDEQKLFNDFAFRGISVYFQLLEHLRPVYVQYISHLPLGTFTIYLLRSSLKCTLATWNCMDLTLLSINCINQYD